MRRNSMEKSSIKNKEITLVKKGIIYYIVKIIIFPFKLLFLLFKTLLNYLKIYLGWIKEYNKFLKKRKNINKSLIIKFNDNEIV